MTGGDSIRRAKRAWEKHERRTPVQLSLDDQLEERTPLPLAPLTRKDGKMTDTLSIFHDAVTVGLVNPGQRETCHSSRPLFDYN
jgi:hypothetical protein